MAAEIAIGMDSLPLGLQKQSAFWQPVVHNSSPKKKSSKRRTSNKKKEPKPTLEKGFSEDFKREHFGSTYSIICARCCSHINSGIQELSSSRISALRVAPASDAFGNRNQTKSVRKYDKKQRLYLDELKRYDRGIYTGSIDQSAPDDKYERVMVWISFCVNVALTICKLVAMILSGSLAVFASFLDSCLDLLSGSIIFLTERVSSRDNIYKYPIGRKRMEALAVIGFSAAMFAAAGQVIVQAIQTLIEIDQFDIMINAATGGILVATILVKLLLWLVCRRFKSSSVRALAADHRNDVFSNIIGFAAALIGFYFKDVNHLYLMADPIGSIIIGIYIMWVWATRGVEIVMHISGKSATPEFLSKLTYIAFIHDPRILAVDTVRAYAVSEKYFVELDIQLPKNMRLKDAHDIGEGLQLKLEKLLEVERAFVHLDYETDHKAMDEHFVPLKLSKALDSAETRKQSSSDD